MSLTSQVTKVPSSSLPTQATTGQFDCPLSGSPLAPDMRCQRSSRDYSPRGAGSSISDLKLTTRIKAPAGWVLGLDGCALSGRLRWAGCCRCGLVAGSSRRRQIRSRGHRRGRHYQASPSIWNECVDCVSMAFTRIHFDFQRVRRVQFDQAPTAKHAVWIGPQP